MRGTATTSMAQERHGNGRDGHSDGGEGGWHGGRSTARQNSKWRDWMLSTRAPATCWASIRIDRPGSADKSEHVKVELNKKGRSYKATRTKDEHLVDGLDVPLRQVAESCGGLQHS